MSERGVFAVDRGLLTDDWFGDEPFSRREAWLWLIANAAWKPRKVRVGTATVTLARGQLCHSLRYMAEAWSWTKSKVDRFLDALEERDSIKTERGTGQTVVTICNYDSFQRVSLPDRDRSGTGSGQERDKEEGRKPIKVISPGEAGAGPKGEPAVQKFPTSFPANWTPGQAEYAAAAEEGLARERVEVEFRRFRNWARSRGEVSVDWMAFWQRWCGHPLRLAEDSARAQRVRGSRNDELTGQAARKAELLEIAKRERRDEHGELITTAGDDGAGDWNGADDGASDAAGLPHDGGVPVQVRGGGRAPNPLLSTFRPLADIARANAAIRRKKSAG